MAFTTEGSVTNMNGFLEGLDVNISTLETPAPAQLESAREPIQWQVVGVVCTEIPPGAGLPNSMSLEAFCLRLALLLAAGTLLVVVCMRAFDWAVGN